MLTGRQTIAVLALVHGLDTSPLCVSARVERFRLGDDLESLENLRQGQKPRTWRCCL
jgi:hypothetical protein